MRRTRRGGSFKALRLPSGVVVYTEWMHTRLEELGIHGRFLYDPGDTVPESCVLSIHRVVRQLRRHLNDGGMEIRPLQEKSEDGWTRYTITPDPHGLSPFHPWSVVMIARGFKLLAAREAVAGLEVERVGGVWTVRPEVAERYDEAEAPPGRGVPE